MRKIPKYTTAEHAFANEIFPQMEDAGIITRRSSPWGAQTKVPPKKKGSPELRVVHNFIPVNRYTIKSQYPVHSLEETLNTGNTAWIWGFYFMSDAANGYWAIPMKAEDCNKTGFITPNGAVSIFEDGARPESEGAAHTYGQFTDTIFGPLPRTQNTSRMPTLIGVRAEDSFGVYMDDHIGGSYYF